MDERRYPTESERRAYAPAYAKETEGDWVSLRQVKGELIRRRQEAEGLGQYGPQKRGKER